MAQIVSFGPPQMIYEVSPGDYVARNLGRWVQPSTCLADIPWLLKVDSDGEALQLTLRFCDRAYAVAVFSNGVIYCQNCDTQSPICCVSHQVGIGASLTETAQVLVRGPDDPILVKIYVPWHRTLLCQP
jgi:hypothetical protein